jgi:hypothetical protein
MPPALAFALVAIAPLLAGAHLGRAFTGFQADSLEPLAARAAPAPDLSRRGPDARVANFAALTSPERGLGPEQLSFWAAGPHRWVEHRSRADGSPARLDYLGPVHGGFALRLPDHRLADVSFAAGGLQVQARSGGRPMTYVWAYEGPVDGRGTACAPCVPQAQALSFVRDHFMK